MRHRDQGRRIVRQPGDLFDAPGAQRFGIVHRSLSESLPWNPLEAVGFFSIRLGFPVDLGDEHGTQFVLDRSVVHFRPVHEIVERHSHPHRSRSQLTLKVTLHGVAQGLARLWMTAACVGHDPRPGPFGEGSLRDQDVTVVAHDVT